jgi:hypothetical protein
MSKCALSESIVIPARCVSYTIAHHTLRGFGALRARATDAPAKTIRYALCSSFQSKSSLVYTPNSAQFIWRLDANAVAAKDLGYSIGNMHVAPRLRSLRFSLPSVRTFPPFRRLDVPVPFI